MPGDSPNVFVSYSHDGEAHARRVLQLAERLRGDGIDVDLDQYVNGNPVEGWPRWMMDHLERADRVLVVCTRTYYRRFRGQPESKGGKGANWEGALVTQDLYDARSRSAKFTPVLFERADLEFVPEPLRGYTFYVVDSDAGYQQLYDALLDQSGVERAPLGPLRRRPRAREKPLAFEESAGSGAVEGSASTGGAGSATGGSAANAARETPSAAGRWYRRWWIAALLVAASGSIPVAALLAGRSRAAAFIAFQDRLTQYDFDARNMVDEFDLDKAVIVEPDRSTDALLTTKITAYNKTYGDLRVHQDAYVRDVTRWLGGSPAIARDVEATMKFMLGDVHAASILALNEAYEASQEVSALRRGAPAGAAADEKVSAIRTKTIADLVQAVAQARAQLDKLSEKRRVLHDELKVPVRPRDQ